MTYEQPCDWCTGQAEHSADIYYACNDHKRDLESLVA